MKIDKKILRSLGVGLAVVVAIIIYAYGFQVTKVNLDETRSEHRQQQLVRILRALAKPDLLEYNQTEVTVQQPIMVPCPADGFTPAEADKSGPYLVIEPVCADQQATIKVSGYQFAPDSSGPINFVPPSQVNLQIGSFETDENGSFTVEVKLPKRESTEIQYISVTTRTNVGSPHLSEAALQTWDKIIETVFLALLATTLGTLLAVPLSFFAAKNLMKDVKSQLIGIAISLILIPFGFYFGVQLAVFINKIAESMYINGWIDLLGTVAFGAAFYFAFRWAFPPVEENKPSIGLKIARYAVFALALFGLVLGMFGLSRLMLLVGTFLVPNLAALGFVGKFIADIGDIFGMLVVVIVAVSAAGFVSSLGDRLSKRMVKTMPITLLKAISVVATMLAGAMLFILIMMGLNWFYQFNSPDVVYYWPGGLGALVGLILALRLAPTDDLPIGIVIYYISRTVWNAFRSIEALVWVIVFVVWVGIGPFAGVLALSLHTIAALTKLYSEQVESIMPGPMEAITATGANRLQTIVYAVVPQIIPPYISFTMYRWDINVRMSTIIGFAGGGGIGFLLYQNINLLNYRAASMQMLAIALVVASMDYLSSKLREKVV
ncbi:MAG TPA: ABC transporter permease subunit [Bellilinea sp.]|nr:ABC transporter permease subunit [Bellilinea sp.]